jgi:hypothetical protein
MNTNIVKLRNCSNGCLPFNANDHENKPYVGISRMRRFRMVDMCKGKRKLWLWGTDDVLVVGLHMVGKRVKVPSLNNVILALYFSFLLLDSSLSYIYCHSSFIFFFSFFILSLSYFFLFLYFSIIYFFLLSFFLFHTHTFLFISPYLDNFSKLSTPLFLACIQSEILNKP